MAYALMLRTHRWADGKSDTTSAWSPPFLDECHHAVGDVFSRDGSWWEVTAVETQDDGKVVVTCERFIDSTGESRPGDHQAMTIERTGLPAQDHKLQRMSGR